MPRPKWVVVVGSCTDWGDGGGQKLAIGTLKWGASREL